MDRIFVGRILGIGAVALGGVGIYLPINILFYGGEPAVWRRRRSPGSHCVRGGRQEKGGKISGLLPLIVCGVVFSFSLLVWGEQILPLFGATDANLPYAYQYIRIICLGIPFSMLITGMNIFINTQGKTMMGMISVIIGAVINQL